MVMEKAEKTILNFKDFKLVHVITLGVKDKSGKRKNNVYTYNYDSKKYTDVQSLTTVYVNSSDYLVFRHTKTKEEIYFSYPHLISLCRKMKNLINILTKKEVFIEKDNTIMLNADYKGNIKIYGAGSGTLYMGFSVFNDNEDLYGGISMYLNNADSIVNLTTDELTTLFFIIEKFDLYSSSLLLLNTTNSLTQNATRNNYSSSNKPKSSGKKFVAKNK